MTPALVLCAVLAVSDGDTITVNCGAGPERVRIADIDAPELRDPDPAVRRMAAAAARALATTLARSSLGGRAVTLERLYADRWGRTIGRVLLDGEDLGAALVASGRARPWPHDDTGRALAPRPEW